MRGWRGWNRGPGLLRWQWRLRSDCEPFLCFQLGHQGLSFDLTARNERLDVLRKGRTKLGEVVVEVKTLTVDDGGTVGHRLPALVVNHSRNTISDFHVPISCAGKSFDSVLLTLFTFLPFLGTRSSTGVIPEFLPQPRELLQRHLLVVDRRG